MKLLYRLASCGRTVFFDVLWVDPDYVVIPRTFLTKETSIYVTPAGHRPSVHGRVIDLPLSRLYLNPVVEVSDMSCSQIHAALREWAEHCDSWWQADATSRRRNDQCPFDPDRWDEPGYVSSSDKGFQDFSFECEHFSITMFSYDRGVSAQIHRCSNELRERVALFGHKYRGLTISSEVCPEFTRDTFFITGRQARSDNVLIQQLMVDGPDYLNSIRLAILNLNSMLSPPGPSVQRSDTPLLTFADFDKVYAV